MTEKYFVVTITSIVSILFLIYLPAYAEESGSIAVNITYTNGDRADYSSVSMKIYQDNSQTPYRIIESITGNPFNILSLPVGHQYKIDVYANGMYSSANYVDLEQTHQDVNVNIPLPGGMRVNVLYNDGLTPVFNALVSVRSVDNKTWSSGFTDISGQTVRFWLEPTTAVNDHYTIDVKIGQRLLYTSTQVYLLPGISQEVKVVTPWTPLVNTLVTVKVYSNQTKLLTSSDGKFVVDLFDYQGNKVMESTVNTRGEAGFYNLKVGDYHFQVINLKDNSVWADSRVTIDGTQLSFAILPNQTKVSNSETPQITQPQSSNVLKIANCNCVAFRLDNVQDYWLDNVQTKIIDIFKQKDAGLTVGIIGKVFGNDSKLANSIKDQVNTNGSLFEAGINGWSFEDFTSFNETQQRLLLEESKNKILTTVGITPVIFVPPYGKVNQDTFYATSDSGIHYISANIEATPPTTLSDKIHNIPATVFTGNHYSENGTLVTMTNDTIMSQIQASIENYGFCVVTLNFQDYALNNGTIKVNSLDITQNKKLESLIDMIRINGLRIVKVSEIENQTNTTSEIPIWIKHSAYLWSENKTSSYDFLIGIQYMVKQNIVKTPVPQHQLITIPSWTKNNAKWWTSGLISDDEFTNGIEFLIKHGIIN